MSSQYKAIILVGLPFKEVFNTEDEFEEFYYKHSTVHTEVIQPFYDAGLEDSLVGIPLVETNSFSYKEVATSIETQKNRELFKQLTGKEAKVYLTVSWS